MIENDYFRQLRLELNQNYWEKYVEENKEKTRIHEKFWNKIINLDSNVGSEEKEMNEILKSYIPLLTSPTISNKLSTTDVSNIENPRSESLIQLASKLEETEEDKCKNMEDIMEDVNIKEDVDYGVYLGQEDMLAMKTRIRHSHAERRREKLCQGRCKEINVYNYIYIYIYSGQIEREYIL